MREGAPPQSDEACMLAFGRGDSTAFAELVRRHERALFNYLFRSVRERTRAEELLQETFLRVVRNKNTYRETAKFKTWLFTIARNLCVDESRRAKHRQHASLDAPVTNGATGTTRLDGVPSNDVPTDAQAHGLQLRARLAAAIEALPADQRDVFLMRQLAEMSFGEIAQAIGIGENTAKSRMRYALEKLRLELADVHEVEPVAATSTASSSGSFVHG